MLFAALFWDANVILLEGSGSVSSPTYLPQGNPRRIAIEAQRKALALAQRATQADATISRRAPFVGFLARVPRPPAR